MNKKQQPCRHLSDHVIMYNVMHYYYVHISTHTHNPHTHQKQNTPPPQKKTKKTKKTERHVCNFAQAIAYREKYICIKCIKVSTKM